MIIFSVSGPHIIRNTCCCHLHGSRPTDLGKATLEGIAASRSSLGSKQRRREASVAQLNDCTSL